MFLLKIFNKCIVHNIYKYTVQPNIDSLKKGVNEKESERKKNVPKWEREDY